MAPDPVKAWYCVTLLALLAMPRCSVSPEPSSSGSEIGSEWSVPAVGGTGGVVEGRVLFEGARIPQSTKVENTTDPGHCGRRHSLENIIVSADTRGVQNAIVALEDIALPEDYKAPASQLVLDNRECRFVPHVSVLTVGSTIEAVNSDPIYHSVHLYGLKQLNVSLHVSKSKRIELPNRPGFVIVKCDVHGWMQAYIRVDRHPFHAVTDEEGRFRMEGVPAGAHGLEVWHEHFGTRKQTVTVEPNTESQVTISFAAQTEGKRP